MSGSKRIAGTALLVAFVAIAQADDAPLLKEGLWSISGSRTDSLNPQKQVFSAKLCRDRAYELHSRTFATSRKECSTQTVTNSPSVYSTTLTCTVGPTRIVSTTTVTYNNRVVHSDSRATYTPAPQGKTWASIVEDQTYIGACPKNMKPGDSQVVPQKTP